MAMSPEQKLKIDLLAETKRINKQRLAEEAPIIEDMERAVHNLRQMLMRRYLADGLTPQEASDRVKAETVFD